MTDPLTGLSSDERWAAGAVAQATGATAHDIGGRQGAVDVTLAYPDRRSGALEVTSHAGDGVQHRDAVLAREEYKWPNPGSWIWFVRFGTAAPIPEMRSRYARIIDLCERAGVGRPEHLPWATQSTDPDLRWLVEYSDMTMSTPAPSTNAGSAAALTVLLNTTFPSIVSAHRQRRAGRASALESGGAQSANHPR